MRSTAGNNCALSLACCVTAALTINPFAASAEISCSPALGSWPFLRSCPLAAFATPAMRSPAALVARAAHELVLALLSYGPVHCADRPSLSRVVAPAPDAHESLLPLDNSACSP